jgi:hypothetical protein
MGAIPAFRSQARPLISRYIPSTFYTARKRRSRTLVPVFFYSLEVFESHAWKARKAGLGALDFSQVSQ